MSANVALTTVFAPPASCFDNQYTSYGGSYWVKDTAVSSLQCYPTGFKSLWADGIPFSPGVCPQSYTTASQASYTGQAGGTAGLCCPSGFAANGLGCQSTITATTTLSAPDGNHAVGSGAVLALHGIYIVWQSGAGSQAPSTSGNVLTVVPVPTTSSSSPAVTSSSTTSSTSTSSTTSTQQTSTSPTSSSSSGISVMTLSTSTRAIASSQTTTSPSLATTTPSTTTASLSSSSPAIVNSAGTGPSSNPSPTPIPGPHSLSTGAKAGIAVGVIVGVLALAALAWFLISKRRRDQDRLPEPMPYSGTHSAEMLQTAGHQRNISELSSDAATPRLNAGSGPAGADPNMFRRSELQG